MKNEKFKTAITELEELVLEQTRELEETQKILSGLRKLAGVNGGNGVAIAQSVPASASNGPTMAKMTYADIALRLLKAADRPMHINEIVKGICLEKNVPIGSIARPSVQTTLMRFMKRSSEIRKAGPGKFKYSGIN